MRSSRVLIVGAVSLTTGTATGVYGYTSVAPHPVVTTIPPVAAGPPIAATPPETAPPTPAATPTAAATPNAGARPGGVPAQAATIARAQVLARARTWHPHTAQRVPYSQGRTFGGYRTDCSGYASMALALRGPGPITVGLATATYTTRIAMSQLRPGDLIIDSTGTSDTRHVVIFVRWTSGAHTAYWEYEQRGGYGTDYRTRTYGLVSGSDYHAYRPKKIR